MENKLVKRMIHELKDRHLTPEFRGLTVGRFSTSKDGEAEIYLPNGLGSAFIRIKIKSYQITERSGGHMALELNDGSVIIYLERF